MIQSTPAHHDRLRRRTDLAVESAGGTDIGARGSNQDQYLIAAVRRRADRRRQREIAGSTRCRATAHVRVADGMGDRPAAARPAVIETIMHSRPTGHPETAISRHLLRLFDDCQSVGHVRSQPQHRGMGTTLTLAWVAWPALHLAHAGDSRAYLLRDGQLRQLTTDHTLAQQFIDSGADATLPSRWEHVLWNVIGGDGRSLRPELRAHELQHGDLLLLCTDGLTRGLSDPELTRIIEERQPLEHSVQRLIETSKRLDGRDNITAVGVRFVTCGCGGAHTSARRSNARTDTWPAMESSVTDG